MCVCVCGGTDCRAALTSSRTQGGCDEWIHLFVHRKRVRAEFIEQMQGKLTGLFEEGEMCVSSRALYRQCPTRWSLPACHLLITAPAPIGSKVPLQLQLLSGSSST